MSRHHSNMGTWIIVLLIIGIVGWQLGWFNNLHMPQHAVETAKSSSGVAVIKPLKFAVIDQWAGSPVASATIKIYKGKTLMETLTTDASGTATSALAYQSGDQLAIEVTNGNALLWKTITVPYMSEVNAKSLTYNPVNIQFYTLGTYSIQVMDGDGNTYTSGGTLNLTTLGKNVVTLTITIYNTQDNTGFMESYDPILGEKRAAYLVATFSGTGYDVLGIQGFQYNKETASSRVMFTHIPADSLVKYKVGNYYQKQGTYAITITIDGSALSAGQSVTMNLGLKLFADGDHYMSTNVWSSESVVDAASFTLTIAK